MSDEELATQLRLHGVGRPEEVARAPLEPNGMVNVLRATEPTSAPSADGRDPAS